MTLEQLIREAVRFKQVLPQLRFGQALYNVLWDHHPDIAEQIRATQLDPYYREEVSHKTWEFLANKLAGDA